MKPSEYFSTQGLEQALTNRKKTDADEKVEWLRLQWLRYEKQKPGIIQYKYTNNNEYPFNEVNVKKPGSHTFKDLVKMFPLFKGPKPIQEAKYKKLLSLLDYVPLVHHEFYRQLTHCARMEEDPNVFTNDIDKKTI